MNITSHHEGHTLFMTLDGNFDGASSPAVEKEVDKVLMEKDVKNVHFDLRSVNYISSIGIRVLILAHKKGIKFGKKVMIGDMSQKVKEVLDVTGILPLFGAVKG